MAIQEGPIRGRYGAEGPAVNPLPTARTAVAAPERAMGAQERLRTDGEIQSKDGKFKIDLPNYLQTVKDFQSTEVTRIKLGRLTVQLGLDVFDGTNDDEPFEHTADVGFGAWTIGDSGDAPADFAWTISGNVCKMRQGTVATYGVLAANDIDNDNFSIFWDVGRPAAVDDAATMLLLFRANAIAPFTVGSELVAIKLTVNSVDTSLVEILVEVYDGNTAIEEYDVDPPDFGELYWPWPPTDDPTGVVRVKRIGVDVKGSTVKVWMQEQNGVGPKQFMTTPITLTTPYNDSSHQKCGLGLFDSGDVHLPWWVFGMEFETYKAYGIEIYDVDGTLVFGASNTITMDLGAITFTGALGPTSGGTGLSSYTLGDTLYSDAANSLAALAGNTTTTKKFLTQTGDGANSAAPGWNAIVDSDIAESAITQHEAALTILESQITDGSILARVAGTETITGVWTHDNHLLFTDNTYDIGASGATRPRTGHFGTSVVVPTVTATSLGGTLTTVTQNNVTTMTGLTTIGTLVAGAVPASLVTAGTFGTGAYVFDNTVSGITTLTATTLAGTLSTAAQPNVTSLGTLAANLLFVNNTYDIGASGATSPRALFLTGDATIAGDITGTGQLDINANAAHTIRRDTTSTGASVFTLANFDETVATNHTVNLRAQFHDTSNNLRQAGILRWQKEQDWTSTASTQDSKLLFQIAQDGSLVNALTLLGSTLAATLLGALTVGGDLTITGDVIPNGELTRYAEISAYDEADTITIAAAGIANKVQITTFDTDGLNNGATPDHTNDHITIVTAGNYLVTVSVTAESAGGGGADEIGLAVYVNNGATLQENLHAHRKLAGGGGDIGSISMSGIATFAASDTVEVWIWNEDSTDDIVIDDINLSIAYVGD